MCFPLKPFKKPIFENLTHLVLGYYNELKTQLNNSKPPTPNQNGVLIIDCEKSCIGETGRELSQRITEHEYDIKTCKPESGIANHVTETAATTLISKMHEFFTLAIMQKEGILLNRR